MASNAKAVDAQGFRKFGLLDKLAYAAGDFGCNTSFALKGSLSIFWTQFMGTPLSWPACCWPFRCGTPSTTR